MESAEELMDFYKLQFLGQLCRLSPYFLVKQVFVQRLIRHISYGNVMFGFIPDICRLVERYGLGHCIDTCIYVSTGWFPGKPAWGRIVNTSVKRPNKRQRKVILNEQWDTDISSAFKLSNSDNIWTALMKTPKYSKYCYNAVRIIGFAVSRQFVSACKRCGKLSNSHVTHAFLVLWKIISDEEKTDMWSERCHGGWKVLCINA